MNERSRSERGPRSWAEARRMARESADNMTDEEDAAITAAALADPDNPPLTSKFWKKARPLGPERLRRMRGQRGPQKSKPLKTRVSLRLDPDVVAFFRKKGTGWQSRINDALRKVAKLPARPKAAKR